MISDDVMNSVEIVAYCESFFFNMEHMLYRKKKCFHCHVKSMITKHQNAETNVILIIRKVYLGNFLNRVRDHYSDIILSQEKTRLKPE